MRVHSQFADITYFRKNVVLNQSCAADQAHLHSHSGSGASDVLCGCPSNPEFRIEAGVSSEPLFWRESDCPCRSLRFVANVGFYWTAEVATEPRAVGRADSRLGLLLQSALWRECAVKPGPPCDTTRNSATWTLLCPRTMIGPWKCSRQVSLYFGA